MVGQVVRANMIRGGSRTLLSVVNKGRLALDQLDPYQADLHFFGGCVARRHIQIREATIS
jgi:hypothetical protein